MFEFKALTVEQVEKLLRRALADEPRGLGRFHVKADDAALRFLSERCDGDGRRALTALPLPRTADRAERAGGGCVAVAAFGCSDQRGPAVLSRLRPRQGQRPADPVHVCRRPRTGPQLVDGTFAISHGTPVDEDAYIFGEIEALNVFRQTNFPICFFGHSHFPVIF